MLLASKFANFYKFLRKLTAFTCLLIAKPPVIISVMSIIDKFLDIFFPFNYTCDLCGLEIFSGKNLCEDCEQTVEVNNGPTCSKCGRKTAAEGLCLECKAQTPSFDRAFSALVYSSGTRKLMLKFKNRDPYLKKYFAKMMAKKCKQITDADAICFVPMLWHVEEERGYNQAQLLEKELSVLLKLPLCADALKKVKKTKSQKTLNHEERLENLKGSFKANAEIVAGKTLIVVDDVLTTGATAEAVCTELKKCGAKKVYFVTAASVEYKAET